MQKLKTSITEKEWQDLTAGDQIIDTWGRSWLVHGWEDDNKTWLYVSCLPQYGLTKLKWENGLILDEEYGIVVDLNQPQTEIIKKMVDV